VPYSDKNFKETNVNYLNKDFASLKNNLIEYTKSYFPNTYKDFNETSPGMMMIEMSAYVGDVLSFYIDQQYREMLLPLAEERHNINNIAKMLGYKIKPIIPAYADLTFTQTVSATSDGNIDYSSLTYNTIPSSTKIISAADSSIIFETLDIVDFEVSGSGIFSSEDESGHDSQGVTNQWEMKRRVRAISGESKTKTFNIGTPVKFLELKLPETNVVNIVSVRDANNNEWYEVDYLAQDKVAAETLRTGTDAYADAGTPLDPLIAVPYTLEFIRTDKRFIVETNDDNTTSLIFGNGILRSGQSIEAQYLQSEQVGITIPGITETLTTSIDPFLGDERSSLGETPMHTILSVTYRIGGGIKANTSSGDLTTLDTALSNVIVTNEDPARGGSDQETIDEIRHRARANFASQKRCVTKQDYEARIMAMPAKFGNIAKVYVARTEFPEMINQQVATVINEAGIFFDENWTWLDDGIFDETDSSVIVPETAADLNDILESIRDLRNTVGDIPDIAQSQLSSITAWVLSYDDNKNLVRITNPDHLIFRNLKNYLSEFRILTDDVVINPGFIINFGVLFKVYSHKHVNKQNVKLDCIEKITDYFSIDKMQFRQPIYVSELEYELMGIDGVRSVDYVCLTQNNNWKDTSTGTGAFDPALWHTEWDPDANGGAWDNQYGTAGYGYKFDFSSAEQGGIILPSVTPSIFELKNSKTNIKGVVL
jgi:hypothetical protein